MDYKKDLEKFFSDSQAVTHNRYEVSRDMFLYASGVFFLNYFFVGAKFYDFIFLKTLPFTYLAFVCIFAFFVFYSVKVFFKLNHALSFGMALVLGVLGILFLLPFSGINI